MSLDNILLSFSFSGLYRMVKPFSLLVFFLFSSLFSPVKAQNKSLRTVENKAFCTGEKLNFRVHYGFVDAGTAVLEVASETQKIGPRECYHVIGTGRSQGAFDWFFKVRDRYESFVDCSAMVPWLFIRNISEGGYKKTQQVVFNHYQDFAKSQDTTISVPEYTQDLISAFYYARTLDFESAKPGDVFPINGYLDDEILPLNIKFIGRETLRTELGYFRCIKFRPLLQEGRVFKEKEDMTVWVSDDANRIPVRVQTDILIGSIKMDLTGYEKLLNPPAVMPK